MTFFWMPNPRVPAAAKEVHQLLQPLGATPLEHFAGKVWNFDIDGSVPEARKALAAGGWRFGAESKRFRHIVVMRKGKMEAQIEGSTHGGKTRVVIDVKL